LRNTQIDSSSIRIMRRVTAAPKANAKTTHQPPSIDARAAKRLASLAQRDQRLNSPWLHEEVGARMAERLEFIRAQPSVWVDWDAQTGGHRAHVQLRDRYQNSQVFSAIAGIHIDFNAIKKEANSATQKDPWWRRWWRSGAAPVALPVLASGLQAQMVWANMLLHRSAEPLELMQQWRDALEVGGFVMFSALGPDSLVELRDCYQEQGWAPPAHAFTDLHDWGDMLLQAGFAEPVMSMERITLTYSNAQALLADLRSLGRNLHVGRSAQTRSRQFRLAWLAALEARRKASADGLLRLSFEVIYGHAVKAAPKLRVAEHSAVSLEDMRAMLRSGVNKA
jgi:malonyl-CoA O-methyltransferase